MSQTVAIACACHGRHRSDCLVGQRLTIKAEIDYAAFRQDPEMWEAWIDTEIAYRYGHTKRFYVPFKE